MNCQNGVALDCPCTAACERHGRCCECVTHHAQKGSLPACLRHVKAGLRQERREQRKLEKQERRQNKE